MIKTCKNTTAITGFSGELQNPQQLIRKCKEQISKYAYIKNLKIGRIYMPIQVYLDAK